MYPTHIVPSFLDSILDVAFTGMASYAAVSYAAASYDVASYAAASYNRASYVWRPMTWRATSARPNHAPSPDATPGSRYRSKWVVSPAPPGVAAQVEIYSKV